MTTQTDIGWVASFDQALDSAAQRKLPIYVDFFSPT